MAQPPSAAAARPVVVVAAAIVDDLASPRRLLSARRAQPVSLAGRWEFPGGKVEPGEDAVTALHRELVEELGVEVELGAELTGPHDGAWRLSDRYVMRLWTARVTAGEPQPLVEHDDLRWLDVGDWLAVPWLDADVPIVHALARSLSSPVGPAAEPFACSPRANG
jgi:8-oxo-dGTP diphosphatase